MAELGPSALNALATLQGTRLFGRQLNLTLGVPNSPTLLASSAFNDQNSHGLDIGLDCDFVIEKSLKPTEPNTLQLKVYNFSEDSRQALSGDHDITVRLEAGYVGGVSQLYFAEARAAWTDAGGEGAATYTTHIESTDTIARPTGVRKTKKIQPNDHGGGNIYRTLGPKVPLKDAFRALSKVLGVGVGNLEQAVEKFGTGIQSVNGSALLGNGAQRMTDICRSAGLEWSIQDGQLQLLNVGGVLSTTQAIQISAATGMLDSPAVDSQGAVSVKTRLIPGLAPGVLVVIDSLFVGSGSGFRVQKCRYVGSTSGDAWDCEFTALPYT